ncbi:UDP-2,3-diacylglucosamine pyrophosphatase LpxH [Rhodothalassium salexigens DSM 2132]|uniref:UDP-2,3-diacylglucosamine pyrophosphatase LpxH n=1 Tax=Rhodothalassium salexigens DSM 2132 TaxID=1188247 RepID=A0A4R2PE36_RHOSA|nr:UDP-2,3-diacylglucosamine diphosphatase [Rhodothalassium salexigens]MBB4211906.1 UDP-2,3-diacylglucosamine pyrophosphatase LpxH [Rhodothalassium salexigens DSM 2132]MBK1639821.1 UDP-2,3-diacylglucosamine hydrolase [Rhodothalassium salexigens DSM 2132]TCP33510.1 UDP-2,3-diacylglucosamine pyrophosphatase LpxH [Rhodothalassium salexigens DSM 2132]
MSESQDRTVAVPWDDDEDPVAAARQAAAGRKRRRPPRGPKRRYRSIFISDVHLGTKGCRADYLLDFMRHAESDYLYLVGDIVDGWKLKKSWYWAPDHNDVVRKVLKRASQGTQVIYIPGNHDEMLRDYVDHDLAGVKILQDTIHETADGRRYWVLHGDEFDGVVMHAKWLAFVGDHAYRVLIGMNTWVNYVRRKLGYSYWSLSAYLKHKTKKAVEFMSNFEESVASEAVKRSVDGVICGHIHHAERRQIQGIDYINDGDWVESCTVLVEHDDGRMEILFWADDIARREAAARSGDTAEALEAAE